MSDVVTHAEVISAALKSLAKDHSFTYHFVSPVWNWIDAIQWPHFEQPEVHINPNNTATQVELTINTMLIDVQEVLKVAGSDERAEDPTSEDRFLIRGLSQVMKCTQSLNLDRIVTHLQQLLVILSTAPSDETSNAVGYLLPFLERYLEFVDSQLVNHHHWTNALFKLTYISCSVARRICNDGFCQPPLEGEEQEGEGKESADGVGMGEGTGKENVSEEIKEESQVEGLEDSGKEGNTEQEKDGDDKAIEMSQDIDGELEDVEAQDEEEEDDELGDESEVEEKAEDLDANDPQAVDEKLWGDEQGREAKDSDDRMEKDHSSEQQGNPEVVAKGSEREHMEERGGKDQAEVTEADRIEDVPEVDEEEPGAQGAPIEDRIEETETLDLPEDLQMGEDEVQKEYDDEGDGESDEGEPGEAVTQDPFPEQEDASMSDGEHFEPDTSQTGQPGETDVEDLDSNQKPDLANPDLHGGADKDYDGMVEPSAETNREEVQTGEESKLSREGQAGEDEAEQMVLDA